MKTLRIERVSTTEHGTFGVIMDGYYPFALTLERQWLNNLSNISCIPDGEYICKRIDSPKFGDTFEVTSVPARTHILFHKGNLDDDSHGCVIVGEQFEPVNGKPGIRASREGYGEFMSRLAGIDEFYLTIIWTKENR